MLAIGTLVPNTGDPLNGIQIPGEDIADTHLVYPALARRARVSAPRGTSPASRRFIVRGGAGLFFDRPPASPNVYDTSQNPPFTRNVALRYGKLQDLGSTGLQTEAPPALSIWQYDMPLPSSMQWNIGTQFVDSVQRGRLTCSYTGQHSYSTLAGVNINNIDIGSAYLPQFADPTQATPTAANSYVSTQPNLVRFYQGYSTITQQQSIGWRTYHSIQLAITRRHEEWTVRSDSTTPCSCPTNSSWRRASSTTRTARSRSATIRRRPRSCSATTVRRRTSCARTSHGTCPICRPSRASVAQTIGSS